MFESNPILTRVTDHVDGGRITFNSIINRTGILVLIAMAAYAVSWVGTGGGFTGIAPEAFMGFTTIGAVAGFILGLVIIFTQSCNPWLIGTYAAGQGFLLGTVSRLADLRYPGIAFQTAGATFLVFFLVLGAYRIRVLRLTPLMGKIILVGLIGVAGIYVLSFIGGLFGHSLGIVNGNGNGAIIFSVLIVALAAISFVLDFARAEAAVESGVDDRFSWRIAFGLLIGLVWLYMEILRLLMKLNSRRD